MTTPPLLYPSFCATPFFSPTALILVLLISGGANLLAQPAIDPSKQPRKDEMRMPWQRSETRFIRGWRVLGPLPGRLDMDGLQGVGGEATQVPVEAQEVKLPNSPALSWKTANSWADTISVEQRAAETPESVAYAFARVTREKDGKAVISFGSQDGARLWLNGKLVLSHDTVRSLTHDEDRIEVDFRKGENTLLVKVDCNRGSGLFSARILESGTVLPRISEIGPTLVEDGPNRFVVKTDIALAKGPAADVQVDVVASGGKVVSSKKLKRGESLKVDAARWPDGPYEVRCTTQKIDGLLFVQHLPWYKGDSLAKAAELLRVAAASDAITPEGMTLRMLVEMVEDRLGSKLSEAKGTPWAKIHSPLMEFDELMQERKGSAARARAHGFYRLAYRDEVDGSAQFCRAYLPAKYSAAKKWPVVIQMHGYNPANPRYVRWWAADSRHTNLDTEYRGHDGVIYLEVHGRGNTSYLHLGDQDVVRALGEAKKRLSVDEDRVYLTGDSMGGWGTWNVGTRHPELFAAIAPVFGGVDYHSEMTEEQLAKLDPISRFYHERRSSWATADSLLNLPIFVHHGDRDAAVKVDYSRWGVQLLQRWGYNVRYREYPGYAHESLAHEGNAAASIEWFLGHKRQGAPAQVRVRSSDLRTAQAYWVQVDQMESPAAFMVVDAEVLHQNLIRLDTQNVAAITLSPAASLVDPTKPLQIVWNGQPREARLQNGRLQLLTEGTALTGSVKRPALPGSLIDIVNTPFAIVTGTTSTDPDMREECEKKSQAFAAFWREWQKQEPRVFKDTEISDADLARYSLLLVGGPDENVVAARMSSKLLLTVSPNGYIIDGKSFPAKDAVLNLIYPNPLNPDRYVRVVAPTSADGMYLVEPNFVNLGNPEPYFYDFVIQDARRPAPGMVASPHQIRVVSGYFDGHWRLSEALLVPGDEKIRANTRVTSRPKKDYMLSATLLADYQGSYQIKGGPIVIVSAASSRLSAAVGSETSTVFSETDSAFFLPEFNVFLEFTRDATGKVTGFSGLSGTNEFTATKI